MAWLVRGMSLDPKLQPQFEWIDPPVGFQRGWEEATPHSTDTIPTIAKKTGRRKSPPPCFFVLRGLPVVCAAFRGMVESLEPSVHEFHSISLLDKGGNKLPEQFYIINILARLDVLIIEKSDVECSSPRELKKEDGSLVTVRTLYLARYPKSLVTTRQNIGGHHLWRGHRYFRPYWFMSDDLMSLVSGARLKGLDAFPVTEV